MLAWRSKLTRRVSIPKLFTRLPNKSDMSTEHKNQSSIFCISDIHSEFYQYDPEALQETLQEYSPKADYCVLAGDIGSLASIDSYRKVLDHYSKRYPHVVLVAGNHEFYGCNYDVKGVIETLKTECEAFDNVHFLHRQTLLLNGIRFIGATLWSAIDEKSEKMIGDFNHVFQSRFDYLGAFVDDYRFLREELALQALTPEHPTVVVTHHVPTSKLIHPKFYNSPANSAFSTNIFDTLVLKNVKYWFCGHTHESMITSYGDTKAVVNPLGYRFEKKDTEASTKVFYV